MTDDTPDTYRGASGSFTAIAPPDANDPRPQAKVLCGTWLLDAPGWHPLWSQYAMSIVALRDVDGLEPAHKEHPDVTHELLVVAIHPGARQDAQTMHHHQARGDLPFMTPPNVVEQFRATDDEASRVGRLLAKDVADGHLNPDSDGRSQWPGQLVMSLKAVREVDDMIGRVQL